MVWTHEIKPTANRRESRPSGSQNRICFSSLELGGPYRPAGSSLIGTVRANPVAAPAAPLDGVWDVFIFQIFIIGIDKSLPLKFTLLAEIEQNTRFDTCCFQIMEKLSGIRIGEFGYRFEFKDDLPIADDVGFVGTWKFFTLIVDIQMFFHLCRNIFIPEFYH